MTDEQLEDAQGGVSYLKLGDIDGESKDTVPVDQVSLNFSKVEFEYIKDDSLRDGSPTKLKI